MKSKMHAGDAICAARTVCLSIQKDIAKIASETDELNKILNQAEAPDGLKKQAKTRKDALVTAGKAAAVISQRLIEMQRQLVVIPPECEVELSSAEMMLFAYGETE